MFFSSRVMPPMGEDTEKIVPSTDCQEIDANTSGKIVPSTDCQEMDANTSGVHDIVTCTDNAGAEAKVAEAPKASARTVQRIPFLRILVLLIPLTAWLPCVGSGYDVVGAKTACSFGQGLEHNLAEISALQEPSTRLRKWLCAGVEAAKQEEEEKRQAAEDAEQAKVAQAIIGATSVGFEIKAVIGSFTGILGSLACLGWWPTPMKKA